MKPTETDRFKGILPFCAFMATRIACAALSLVFLTALSTAAMGYVVNPDLTAAGVIAALKSDPEYSSRPYSETFNLGATGLRGWIYIDNNNAGDYGLLTAPSRQILVTVASTPASAVLAVDDVILGAMAASTGTVPPFASDCRKALGVAIGEAEKTGAGTLRVSRWRAGVITDENIPMAILGNYTATSPYTCPKSALVLANARIKLVSQLKADSNFLSSGYGGAIKGLALLASVVPGDADYAIVQTRLKSYANTLAANTLQPWGMEWWDWSYMSIFLSEYYLRTVEDGAPDASILAGISRYTVTMAKGQSRYGTFSHGGTPRKPDGSLHGTVTPYGPVNAAGIPTNIAIVMGKKALVAGGQAIDPEIDPAIQRGSDFFKYYVNKGSIPYGEHEPWAGGHASNGKDPMCAVLFGLQDNRPAEAEYFARMSVAGCTGREYGHSGQGLSYLWGAMGANIGGPTAVAKYMENFRWHTDLVRRTDGSFSYDGQEQYGGGKTEDGSYLGKCGYNDMNPTATYILSFGVSLQRLYITGRNAIPANTLSAAKVTDAIAAATYKLDYPAFTTTQLLADLSAYDPVVRNSAATQLASRTLTTTELNSLIASITNGTMSTDPSTRMGACQALGARQAAGALTALGQRLSDTDLWVRGKAAQALRIYGSGANGQRDTMLTAYATNATDPEVIVWDDPVQIANNFLSFALFGDSVYGGGNIASHTISASKNLLYPAVKAGLKQPDSNPRLGVANFAKNYLTLADAQALTPDLFAAATTEALADTMWHGEARAAGIQAVAKYKPAEAVPIALSMMEVEQGYGWGAHHFQIAALNVMSSFGDSARWTLPALRQYALTWETTSSQFTTLNNTIASIEAAITSPVGMINLVAVATPQVVVTPVSTAKAITLAGTSPRGALTFSNVTTPAHGTLTGTAPNLIYTPAAGYTGPDHFTFKVSDSLTTSETGTVSLIMGTAGTGLKGEYFDNTNFTNLKLTRTDAQLNFDWSTGTPDALIGADTFSVRWSGQLLVPETGTYTFSTLNSDGARLFINGVPVINDYVDQTTSWKDGTPISLTAGQRVELQMEYYENTGSAVAKLKWRGPTLAGINGSIIAKEWLYDGAGISNRTPYAHAQTVSLIQDTSQAITLTGSGIALTPLVYSIISQPAHGTLSGVAPNLTYTPAANFSGSDSFTFLVNNGTSNSSPATVSIAIWGGSPTSYFWTNAVAGAWSGSFWSNAAGGSVTPAAAGNSAYSLNFNKPSTYATTQDLNTNYVFNQLNLAGAVTFDGSNSLALTSNGSLLPQINQNSASAVIINTPVSLAAMTSFGGIGGGSIDMNALISGAGGVNKDCPGTLQIYGLTPNTYSGGTIISGGTLHLGGFIGGSSINCINPLGTGPVTLNSGGSIQFDRVSTNNALIANGGTLYTPNGWGANWSGVINLNGTVTANAPNGLTCSGAISGAGGFTKVGGGTLALTGTNSFTGTNRINAGTLSCSKAAALGAGHLDITLGAKVALNFTGTRAIAALTFNGGAPLAPGTYGSTTSPATTQNNTYFSGNGTITILPASSTALALSSGNTPSDLAAPLTFTATVTGAAPTGNVAFYDGTTLLGSGTLNGSFQASFTTSSLAIGSHTITAKYAGNATHAASTSAVVAIEITSLFAPPPTNLFAVRELNSVGLTWTVSTGATSYNVKRSLTNDGPYTTIGTSVMASYNDLTALNSSSYYYVVSANNALGESANSTSVGVMPLVPSSAKNILTFVFPGLPAATISGTNISLTVATATAVTALAPTYTVSPWATGSPASGTSRNFSTPQTYTITASDNSTQTYTVTVTVVPAPLTYNFNDATLQGWNNRVWNGSAWIDLAANATTYAGTLLPVSSNNGLFAPGNGAVWVNGSTDFHLNTLWLRSPQFHLNGTGDLTVQLAKGTAKTTAPANDLAVPFAAIDGGGWKGVALRRVSDGVFVLNKPRDVGNDDAFRTVTFTQAELATLDFNAAYTLELINSDRGSWGWLTMDNVSIPGIAIVALSSTTLTSSLGATGAYGSAVTFTATVAVTGGTASGTVTFKDGVTVLGTGTLASGTATFATSTLAMGAHSITASYGGNATYATSVSSGFGYAVTAKPLTLAGVTAGNKIYDATTAATLIGGSLSGVVSGETVTITAGSGTLASANAGLRDVTATGYALGGAHAGNYSLAAQPLVPAATINTCPLIVTASNQSKTRGQTVVFGSGSTQFTSSGLQNSETIGSVTLACTGGGAVAAVAPYLLTASEATGGTFTAGNYAIQYVDGIFTVNPAPGYETWASDGGHGLTPGVNDDPSDDPDGDGFSNLMEFALGGAPMASSAAIQPTFSNPTADWVFEYNRNDAAQAATTQVVEYGSNLTGWTPVIIPATSGSIVEITPGIPSDHVKVTIPNQGSQTFVRLKVSQP